VEPATLADLVRQAVLNRMDHAEWDNAVAKEKKGRLELRKFADQYKANHHK
jgi:hypothetical protein